MSVISITKKRGRPPIKNKDNLVDDAISPKSIIDLLQDPVVDGAESDEEIIGPQSAIDLLTHSASAQEKTEYNEITESISLQDRAIQEFLKLSEDTSPIEKWALAYKNAGSILMHQYGLEKGNYTLLDLFNFFLARSKIHFGEEPIKGDIIFLESNGFMVSGKIVESVHCTTNQHIPSSIPVWMIDQYKRTTRGISKQYSIKALGYRDVITSWYAIARIDQ